MTNRITIELRNIPENAKFGIFDEDDRSPRKKVKVWEVGAGDTDLTFDMPNDWTKPKARLRTRNYYSPVDIFDVTGSIIQMSGADFYIDVGEDTEEGRINQKEIETLIHGISASENLSERQKFYVSLASLQSYFEYLVYGMLVLSECKTESEHKKLYSHQARSQVAFDKANTNFREPVVTIAPGKSIERSLDENGLAEQETNFENVRTMRNQVLHSWFHRKVTRQKITQYLANCGEVLGEHLSEEDFYKQATHSLIRLYAKAYNTIGGKVLHFEEKVRVQAERANRGY